MEIKLSSIISSEHVLSDILNSKLKAKTAFKLRQVMKFVADNVSLFESVKKDIIEKYNLLNDNNELNIPKEIEDEVNSEFQSLLDQTISMDISIPFEDIEDIEISAIDLDKVFWLFEE